MNDPNNVVCTPKDRFRYRNGLLYIIEGANHENIAEIYNADAFWWRNKAKRIRKGKAGEDDLVIYDCSIQMMSQVYSLEMRKYLYLHEPTNRCLMYCEGDPDVAFLNPHVDHREGQDPPAHELRLPNLESVKIPNGMEDKFFGKFGRRYNASLVAKKKKAMGKAVAEPSDGEEVVEQHTGETVSGTLPTEGTEEAQEEGNEEESAQSDRYLI